jgi:hypothetical protein
MQPFRCTACGAGAEPDARGGIICAGCGAVLASPFSLCPRCGRVNAAGAALCVHCETELTAACPGCGRMNWSGAERCTECGREMDLLAHAFRPVSASFEVRRREMLQRASSLREEAERESQARLEMLHAADRRRMQRAAEREERARRRERRIVIGAGAAAVVLTGIAIAAVILAH